MDEVDLGLRIFQSERVDHKSELTRFLGVFHLHAQVQVVAGAPYRVKIDRRGCPVVFFDGAYARRVVVDKGESHYLYRSRSIGLSRFWIVTQQHSVVDYFFGEVYIAGGEFYERRVIVTLKFKSCVIAHRCDSDNVAKHHLGAILLVAA